MRIVLGIMKIDMTLHTPKIGKLSKYWHECNELCHIAWPLSCSEVVVRKIAYATLTEVSQSLSAHVSSLGWPVLKDAAFAELRNRFIAGEATPNDVLAHVQQTGIWARATFTDGTPPQFVDEAVARSASGLGSDTNG